RAEELPREVEAEIRAEGGEGSSEEHAERQTPALVLRRQDEEHEEARQREHRGAARGPPFLERQIGPVEGHVWRKHCARRLLEGIERLRRREAFGRYPRELGGP